MPTIKATYIVRVFNSHTINNNKKRKKLASPPIRSFYSDLKRMRKIRFVNVIHAKLSSWTCIGMSKRDAMTRWTGSDFAIVTPLIPLWYLVCGLKRLKVEERHERWLMNGMGMRDFQEKYSVDRSDLLRSQFVISFLLLLLLFHLFLKKQK